MDMSKAFNNYLKSVYDGADPSEKARDEQIRDDYYNEKDVEDDPGRDSYINRREVAARRRR
jgi:hypothetical protein